MAVEPKPPMPAMKPPMQGEPKMPSQQEVQSLLSEIDSVIGKPGSEPGGEASGPGLPAEEKFSSTMPETPAEPGVADVKPIADMLDVSMEKAQAIYDAAQQMEQTKGKSPADLADMLDKNMSLRMQLEKTAAGSEDEMMRDAMEKDGLKVPTPSESPLPM